MTGARTNTLATLRGNIERIETHGDAYAPRRVVLGHVDADATLQGGLALAARGVHGGRPAKRRGDGFCRRARGAGGGTAAAGVGASGFHRN